MHSFYFLVSLRYSFTPESSGRACPVSTDCICGVRNLPRRRENQLKDTRRRGCVIFITRGDIRYVGFCQPSIPSYCTSIRDDVGVKGAAINFAALKAIYSRFLKKKNDAVLLFVCSIGRIERVTDDNVLAAAHISLHQQLVVGAGVST